MVVGLYGQRIADQPGYHAGRAALYGFTTKHTKNTKAGCARELISSAGVNGLMRASRALVFLVCLVVESGRTTRSPDLSG